MSEKDRSVWSRGGGGGAVGGIVESANSEGKKTQLVKLIKLSI